MSKNKKEKKTKTFKETSAPGSISYMAAVAATLAVNRLLLFSLPNQTYFCIFLPLFFFGSLSKRRQ